MPGENNAKPEEVFACKARFPVVSPDETLIAFFEEKTSTFKIVDLSDKSVAASWSGPNRKGQPFICWSADGRRLAMGYYSRGGLWIYDVDTERATRIFDGSFAWCSWSVPDMSHMAIERVYGPWHQEIWIAEAVEEGVPMVIRTF